MIARLVTNAPQIAAYIAAWEWVGILGVIGVFVIAGVVTSHIIAPAVWRMALRLGRDPEETLQRHIARIRRRAEA